jgi:hypothetical protein
MTCDENSKGCIFRINGVYTDKILSSEFSSQENVLNVNGENLT